MSLKFRFGNIIDVKFHVAAIVNSANPESVIGGGVEEAIYRAAGEEALLAERRKIGEIKAGQAKLSSGCNMHNINSADSIIHTVATPWVGGSNGEKEVLKSCYLEALKIIHGKNIKTAAFPLLGTGAYGFPLEVAFNIAVETISDWLINNSNKDIWLVSNNPDCCELFEKYKNEHADVFLDNNYIEADRSKYLNSNYDIAFEKYEHETEQINRLKEAFAESQKKCELSAEDFLRINSTELDLASTLQLLMSEYKVTSSDFFNKNIFDSSYYGKIINRINKSVEKNTVMAMGFVMKLSEEDFNKLLASAGYALMLSSKTDQLALWCIRNKKYDLDKEVRDIYVKYKVKAFY